MLAQLQGAAGTSSQVRYAVGLDLAGPYAILPAVLLRYEPAASLVALLRRGVLSQRRVQQAST